MNASLRGLRWRTVAAIAVACVGISGCMFYMHPKCNDGILNGNETDVDCGGSCGPCAIGQACRVETDCDNGYCAAGQCAPLPCFNGMQDGAETDVDCGGGTCRKCAGGRRCLVGADCFDGKCDAATNTCAARQVSFSTPVAYDTGYKSYAITSADLDGDGILDLAVANEEGDSVSIYLGRGDGTFRRAADIPTGLYPTSIVAADFNRDGILDLITANYHGNSVSVLIGGGNGTFLAPVTYPTVSPAQTQNLAVGDLNHDGKLDVVAANPLGGSLSIFFGRGDGTLAPAVNVPVGVEGVAQPFAVAIADFDGDGNEDLAIVEGATRTIIVRLGNGDGTFRSEVPYPGTGNIYVHDMNADGILDLVTVNRSTNSVSVFLGRGDGTFRDAVTSSTGPTGPYTIAIGDFNEDGVPDVVAANFTSAEATILLGVGDGSFDPPMTGGDIGALSYGVTVGDFNRDGHLDFATCNAGANDMKVSLSTSR